MKKKKNKVGEIKKKELKKQDERNDHLSTQSGAKTVNLFLVLSLFY